jgi:hypothetical protein
LKVNGGFSHGKYSRGMNITTYLHLELRFRITKAVTLLPIYVFVVQRGTALLFAINVTFLLI